MPERRFAVVALREIAVRLALRELFAASNGSVLALLDSRRLPPFGVTVLAAPVPPCMRRLSLSEP